MCLDIYDPISGTLRFAFLFSWNAVPSHLGSLPLSFRSCLCWTVTSHKIFLISVSKGASSSPETPRTLLCKVEVMATWDLCH